ncbi:MAG: insulinase family protein [Chloroflexi bacterium]|nr:insulinase family protein [Chloroflexota bacterium]
MYQKTVLDNGLRVVTSTMPHAHSVSLVLFIAAGSRYESPEEAGLSHFAEHLCFKGTPRRPTAKAISEAIEGLGGVLNGGTDKEATVYWAKVARPHFRLALDVISDMVCHSLLEPAEIEKERLVITEEINMSRDSPAFRVDLLIDEVLWPDHPLGRDVAGSKETVSHINQGMLRGYLGRQYLPNAAVVGVAGAVDHGETVAAIAEQFRDWLPGAPLRHSPASDNQTAPRARTEWKETEQAHLCLALRGIPLLHPDRYALDLLSVVLGEGMSSRLFQEIREKQGLAYDIHSYISYFQDTGSLAVSAGVDPQQLPRTITAILRELGRLREPVPDEELTKAREMTKGRMLLRLEDSRAVAGWLAGQELLTGRVRTIEELLAILDGVTTADLQRVAGNLLTAENLNLAVVGPVKEGANLQELLRFE